jgi:hypothetical protein
MKRRKRKKSDKPEIEILDIVDADRSDLELRISSFDKQAKSRETAIKQFSGIKKKSNLEKEKIIKEIEERQRNFKKIKRKQRKLLRNDPTLIEMLAQRKADELIRKKLEENAIKEAEVESFKEELKKELEVVNSD